MLASALGPPLAVGKCYNPQTNRTRVLGARAQHKSKKVLQRTHRASNILPCMRTAYAFPLYQSWLECCPYICGLGTEPVDSTNPRHRILMVRKDMIHNENPWQFELRRKRNCCWPKWVISSSSINLVALKNPKNVLILILHSISTYLGTSTSMFGSNPKPWNMHILAYWVPLVTCV